MSHVLPEFLYRSAYDDEHRLVVISTRKDRGTLLVQKGVREQLLCQSCETRLGELERYSSQVLVQRVLPLSSTPGLLSIPGIDYRRFKLFQASLLWRASVAKERSFENVQLGPYEEPLRLALVSDQPGEPDRYPCLMTLVTSDQGLQDTLVMPVRAKLDRLTLYSFIAGSIAWTFAVGKVPPPPWFLGFAIRPDGVLRLYRANASFLLRDIVDRLSKEGKLSAP
jgi:hypothetical protein